MRDTLLQCALLVAAGVLSVSTPSLAGPGHGGGGDGSAMKPDNSGHGNSGNAGNNGNHGPPTTTPGNGGNAGGVKVEPPAGTCDAAGSTDLNGINVQGPDGQSGASHVAHTNFGLIDPTTGNPVASSESATMMYFWYGSTFDFVLNAHGLAAGSKWTLTYQPEPLPSSGVVCLGNATVNNGGQLHLAASVELNSNLPPALDPTADPSTQPPNALLALVPTADVDCTGGTNTTFEPDVALWSNPRVRFVDTDLLPAVQTQP